MHTGNFVHTYTYLTIMVITHQNRYLRTLIDDQMHHHLQISLQITKGLDGNMMHVQTFTS